MAHRQLWCNLVTLGVVILMVLAAELSGEREILFPEVTAIAIGLFLAPKQSWRLGRTCHLPLDAGATVGKTLRRFLALPTGACLLRHRIRSFDLRWGAAGDAGDPKRDLSPLRHGSHRTIGVAATGVGKRKPQGKTVLHSSAPAESSRLATATGTMRHWSGLHPGRGQPKCPLCSGAAHFSGLYRIFPSRQPSPADPHPHRRTDFLLCFGRGCQPVFPHDG